MVQTITTTADEQDECRLALEHQALAQEKIEALNAESKALEKQARALARQAQELWQRQNAHRAKFWARLGRAHGVEIDVATARVRVEGGRLLVSWGVEAEEQPAPETAKAEPEAGPAAPVRVLPTKKRGRRKA